jgi:hypothetical protein
MSELTSFRPGTTKAFALQITLNGSNPDITSDAVAFLLKASKDDLDVDAEVTKAGDVASEGATGIVNFTLLPADTASLDPGGYYVDIVWTLVSGAEYVIHSQLLTLLTRVSDA